MSTPAPTRRLFTVDEYYRMSEAGILPMGERTELINGEIIRMASIGSRHAACVNKLNRMLVTALADRAVVTIQNPVRLSDLSEPQPDITVARSRADDYAAAHPTPPEILLVIEVADTSLGFDRGEKKHLYAATRIPEYWIVDVGGATVDVHRTPGHDAYDDVRTYRRGDSVSPSAFPDLTLPVEAIMP